MSINIALFGAGHWGPNLLRIFQDDPRARVRWVLDVDRTRLLEVQARYPDVHLAQDTAAAFADEAVDAVVIATPTATHFELAREALRLGKHVLVEKPLTTDAAEGEELLDLARSSRCVLMVGHVFLYNPAVRWVCDYMRTGRLGRPLYFTMSRTNLGPVRRDVNAAWDLAAHDVSIANYWLGHEPVAVTATGGRWINPGIEDAVFLNFVYPDEVLVQITASWLNPRKTREITVVGSEQMLTFDDMTLAEPVRIYDRGVTHEPDPAPFPADFAAFRSSVREGDITIPRITSAEPLRLQCGDFLDCIETGQAPVSGGEVGLAVVRALEAAELSIRQRGAFQAVGDRAG